jgi:hypothetical protein
MTIAAHTPGPWTITHARDGTGDVGIKAPGVLNIIAECYAAMRRHDERSPETVANARLMAAAPTMLAALQKYRDQYGSPDTWPDDEVECLAAADAAIALATQP